MIKIECQNEAATVELGKKLAGLLGPGDFIGLDGDLGAGKTFLSQTIIRSLGVTEYVTSPSYTIVNEYGNIYHFDVYRINDIDEMYEIGYEEYFYSDGICLVEWASMIEPLIPPEHFKIHIQHGDTFTTRLITLTGSTPELEKRLEALK